MVLCREEEGPREGEREMWKMVRITFLCKDEPV